MPRSHSHSQKAGPSHKPKRSRTIARQQANKARVTQIAADVDASRTHPGAFDVQIQGAEQHVSK